MYVWNKAFVQRLSFCFRAAFSESESGFRSVSKLWFQLLRLIRHTDTQICSYDMPQMPARDRSLAYFFGNLLSLYATHDGAGSLTGILFRNFTLFVCHTCRRGIAHWHTFSDIYSLCMPHVPARDRSLAYFFGISLSLYATHAGAGSCSGILFRNFTLFVCHRCQLWPTRWHSNFELFIYSMPLCPILQQTQAYII